MQHKYGGDRRTPFFRPLPVPLRQAFLNLSTHGFALAKFAPKETKYLGWPSSRKSRLKQPLTEKQTEGLMDRRKEWLKGRYGQPASQPDRQTDRQTVRQSDSQTYLSCLAQAILWKRHGNFFSLYYSDSSSVRGLCLQLHGIGSCDRYPCCHNHCSCCLRRMASQER